MNLKFWRGLVVFAIVSICFATRALAQGPASSCNGSDWHSFDFWIGEWEVFDAVSGSKDAHVRVTSVSGGCALREEYDAVSGAKGESLSSWDAAHHVWRQYWVSGKGQIVSIEGNLRDGAMILEGAEEGTHAPDLVRGIWKPETGGTVRETAWRSTDNGKTWQPWFDLIFRRAAATH